jgi:hypothetical protein
MRTRDIRIPLLELKYRLRLNFSTFIVNHTISDKYGVT